MNYLLKGEVSGVSLLKMEDKMDLVSIVWGMRFELFVERRCEWGKVNLVSNVWGMHGKRVIVV